MRIAKRKISFSKKFLAFALIILVIGLTYGAYTYYTSSSSTNSSTPTRNSANASQDINYNPPTDQEIKSSQDAKKNNGNQSEPTNPTPSEKKSINVAVSYAGLNESRDALEIRAFIPGIVESSGTCTANVTNGTDTVRKDSPAFADATSTICQPIYINKSSLSKGTWYVTVSYSSPLSMGISDKRAVNL